MKIALILIAFLAIINFSFAAYPDPVGYTKSIDKTRGSKQAGPYYPALHTIVQGEEGEEDDSDSSSSEEDVTQRSRTRLTYRSASNTRKRRPEMRSLDRSRVVDENDQVPRRVYDYGMYDRNEATTQAPETTTRYQWQWRPCYSEQECYRQYVDEYYRFYSQNQYGGSSGSGSSSSSSQQSSSSSTSGARRSSSSDSSSGAAPTKLPPRLLLKSGDNVHFGEGINWSIYKTDSGLTRVGTRDGEVVVRVVRPSYDDYQQRRRTAPVRQQQQPQPTTQAPPPASTPYQWQWQPCYTEQECYRQYVNEYYRYYAHNQ